MSNNLFPACVRAEYLKTRRSSTFWVTVLFPFMIGVLVILIFPSATRYLRESDSFTEVVNLWDVYWDMGFESVAMFLPIYIISIAASFLAIERRDKSWKKTLTVPASRAHIYFAKVLFLTLLLMVEMLAMLIAMTIGAYVIQVIHPDLKFSSYILPWGDTLRTSVILVAGTLGILAVHYVCSLFIKSRALVVNIGMVLSFISMISLFAGVFEPIKFLPYRFPLSAIDQEINIDKKYLAFEQSAPLLSILYFIVIIGVGFLFFNKSKSFGSK